MVLQMIQVAAPITDCVFVTTRAWQKWHWTSTGLERKATGALVVVMLVWGACWPVSKVTGKWIYIYIYIYCRDDVRISFLVGQKINQRHAFLRLLTYWGRMTHPLPLASVHWLVQCTLECHWGATGWPSVHWDTNGRPSEYLQGTLEHHWKN